MARTSRADRRIAIHEAGHVVASWWVGRDVWSATIVPSEVAAGLADCHVYEPAFVFEMQHWDEIYGNGLFSEADLSYMRLRRCVGARRDMIVNLAGAAAESKYLRESFTTHLVFGGGAHDCVQSWKIGDHLPEGRSAAMHAAERVTRRLVRDHWEIIKKVADALLEHRTLNQDQLAELLPSERGYMCKLEFTAAWDINMGDEEMEAA